MNEILIEDINKKSIKKLQKENIKKLKNNLINRYEFLYKKMFPFNIDKYSLTILLDKRYKVFAIKK
jgi:hypothetical protein